MMDFKTMTLADLSTDGKGSYGIAASAVDYSDDLYTYLRITDIRDDGTLNKDDLKSVNDEKADQYLLEPNDIVFARTGASTGRNYFYDGSDGQFVYAGFLIKFSIDPEKVNPKYIKYYCMSADYKGWVHSFNTGSTRGNINAKTLGGMPIPIPAREQQDGIVTIMSAIDDKIKKNNEINKNLQAQAQAIYTKKFITDADSSWPEGKLSDLIEVCYGKDHKKLNDGDIPVYGSGGIMRHADQSLYDQESVLVPRKGTLNNVMYVNEPFWSVDTTFFTKMKRPNVAKFVFHFLKGKDLASMNAGSAVPSMTTKILDAIPLQIPDNQTLSNFEAQVSPYYEAMAFNNTESENLAALRDALLPKLMSGEIDVSAINL